MSRRTYLPGGIVHVNPERKFIHGDIERPQWRSHTFVNDFTGGVLQKRHTFSVPFGYFYKIDGFVIEQTAGADFSQSEPCKIFLQYTSNGERYNDEMIPIDLWGGPGISSDIAKTQNRRRSRPLPRYVKIDKWLPRREDITIVVEFPSLNFPEQCTVTMIGNLRKVGTT